MHTKAQLIEKVKSRDLRCPHPQLEDLQDVTVIFPFLSQDEAVDLLRATGASKFDYWEYETPEEALQGWMKQEGIEQWPDPLPYNRRSLMDEVVRRVDQLRSMPVSDTTGAIGLTIIWTLLYALEDGEVLIEMYRGEGSFGGELYVLVKAVQEFYDDDYRELSANSR